MFLVLLNSLFFFERIFSILDQRINWQLRITLTNQPDKAKAMLNKATDAAADLLLEEIEGGQ